MPFDGNTIKLTQTGKELISMYEKALEKISTPETWTKGHSHFDGKFCAMEALCRTEDLNCLRGVAYQTVNWLANKRGFNTLVTFNDFPKTTYEDVIALFHEAIEIAKDEFSVMER